MTAMAWLAPVLGVVGLAIAATLYSEDIDAHWQGMQDYAKPELLGDEWEATELVTDAQKREGQVA